MEVVLTEDTNAVTQMVENFLRKLKEITSDQESEIYIEYLDTSVMWTRISVDFYNPTPERRKAIEELMHETVNDLLIQQCFAQEELMHGSVKAGDLTTPKFHAEMSFRTTETLRLKLCGSKLGKRIIKIPI